MPQERARSPIGGLEGAGWYVGDSRNVTNRSNARYPGWLGKSTAKASWPAASHPETLRLPAGSATALSDGRTALAT
jgi:hypothetical protein